MTLSSWLIVALAKTMKYLSVSEIYADNFFHSLPTVRYMKEEHDCWYIGTAWKNRIGHPNIMDTTQKKEAMIPKGI